MILAIVEVKHEMLNEHKQLIWFSRMGGSSRDKNISRDAQRLNRQRKVSRRPETSPNPCKQSLFCKTNITDFTFLSVNNTSNIVIILVGKQI